MGTNWSEQMCWQFFKVETFIFETGGSISKHDINIKDRGKSQPRSHIAHLRQHYHNWELVILQEKGLKVLNCCNFLWVQRRHNCSPAASFANCVMTLDVLKKNPHMQRFLSIPITQKCQNSELWHSCRKSAIYRTLESYGTVKSVITDTEQITGMVSNSCTTVRSVVIVCLRVSHKIWQIMTLRCLL